MTPEEQEWNMAQSIRQALAQQQQQPGMINQGQLSPEQYALAQQDYSAQSAKLQQQQVMAREMMARAGEQPGGIQAGNVYVAGASPMSALASAIRGYSGGKAMRESNEGYDDLAVQEEASAEAAANIAANEHAYKRQQDADAAQLAQDKLEQDKYEFLTDLEVDANRQADTNALKLSIAKLKGKDTDEGGGKKGTYKNPKRWRNIDGEEKYTIDLGMDTIDKNTKEVLPANWISDGGFYEEDAMSGSGRTSALHRFQKESKKTRMLAVDYTAMLDTFQKYGYDLEDGGSPFSWFEKGTGKAADIARLLGDHDKPGTPAAEMFSATSGVLNAVIRASAGLAQTAGEMKKIDAQYGNDWFKNPAVMGEALRRLGPAIKQDIAAQVNTLDDTSLELYRARLKDSGSPDWTQWTNEPTKPKGDTDDDGWTVVNGVRIRKKGG